MFARLMNLFRGFLGLFISGMERNNPEALLEIEKENLRKQIGQYNDGLASHAGLCERLMTQIRRQEKEEKELRAKTTAHLKVGNKDAAGQFALRFQKVQEELRDNRAQLEQAETTYKDLVKARDVSIKSAQAKFEALKNSISDLKIKKATAELAEMASGLITKIGGSGDTLDRLEKMVEEEREKAAGKARVAKDSLDTEAIELKDAEQKAYADQALADFAAEEGITLTGDANEEPGKKSSQPPQKSMGPGTKAAES